ncbi:MAG: ATP-dependent helicase [Anaerolineae bacterium]|nr:ATP-dependent helicase [Anaerolineae bacterium]
MAKANRSGKTRNARFRQNQQKILKYEKGKMAVSAVPGAGKTFTLAHLAAKLAAKVTAVQERDEQEVLVVTFSNSAVNTLKARIADILQQERGLLPYVGYRVRTLHGLAHDIVRERPALVGLAEDFRIVDERVAEAMLRDVVAAWLRASGDDLLMPYIDPETESQDNIMQRIRREELPELAFSIAAAFIRQAKDRELTPQVLREQFAAARKRIRGLDLPLVAFGIDVYEAYARSLSYRGAVDFDDLVRLALLALNTDKDYLARLQNRWQYILEDEAQDSSKLQEKMLRLLSAGKNWVRVGDPNQAINTTFTTANPQFLRDFLEEDGVKSYTLAEAGRSAEPIIDLANRLLHWAVRKHPVDELRNAFYAQDIVPTAADDAQANPSGDESRVHITYEPGKEITPEQELKIVANSLEKWLHDESNATRTCAVLVPDNSRGFKLAEALRERGLLYEELLRSTTSTRDAAEALYAVLTYLASPTDYGKLAALYRDLWWVRNLAENGGTTDMLDAAMSALSKNRTVESFLFPADIDSPFDALDLITESGELLDDLENFRQRVRRWLTAISLPIDQLVLTIGQDIFNLPTDIALTYKIAQLLRGMANSNPDWRLSQFAEELKLISQNQRRFIGFDDADQGYRPATGRVTIATMHAAKGLEWDRVYLMAVNNYSFPSAQEYDRYISERWYLRRSLNLEVEVLAQLEAISEDKPYFEGQASIQARIDYSAERLRLLYVGITRAMRELVITWNTGRGRQKSSPALPLVVLAETVRVVP